ncbi:MAG: hypothetical protein R3B57_14725 [Phycisphaerales bacterium]
MRRKALTALFVTVAATLVGGCAGSTPTALKAEPGRPLWAPGAGDALGAGSFQHPVVIAAYEARQDGTAYASVPTD